MRVRINILELVSALTGSHRDLEALAGRYGSTASALRKALLRGSWRVVEGSGQGTRIRGGS